MAFPIEGNCIRRSMALFFLWSSLEIFGLLHQWPFLEKGIVLETSIILSCLNLPSQWPFQNKRIVLEAILYSSLLRLVLQFMDCSFIGLSLTKELFWKHPIFGLVSNVLSGKHQNTSYELWYKIFLTHNCLEL